MVQIIQDQGLFGPNFQEGIGALAQAMQGLGQKYERQKQLSTLGDIMQQPDITKRSALAQAFEAGIGPEEATKAFGDLDESKMNFDNIRSQLITAGFSTDKADQLARIYQMAPTGGKTKLTEFIMDQISRGFVDAEDQTNVDEMALDDANPQQEGFQYPKINNFVGMTPKERIAAQREYRKVNAPIVQETEGAIRTSDATSRRLNKMQQLNDSGKLPKNMGRLNINYKTGDLVVPAAANKETQLFVKMVNDFTTLAKDSYGARVTNFELERFLQRLPTLANSSDGRKLILEEMQTINQLDNLYNESLRDAYRKYGMSNADPLQIQEIAENARKDKEEELLAKFYSMDPDSEYKANDNEVELIYQGKRIAVPQDQVDAALRAGAVKP